MAQTLGSLSVDIQANMSKWLTAKQAFTSGLTAMDAKTTKVVSSIGLALTGIGITTGIMAGVAIGKFASFEQKMVNAAAVAQASQAEYKRMSKHARDLGKSTVFTAGQAADAMYTLASAGYDAQQQMVSTEAILDLAAGTQTDLATATETVVKTLKAFNLPADKAGRVTNVFAAAVSQSLANMGKLDTSMPYVATTFNLLGYEVETAAAALSVLYDNGLEASTAGTRLRGAMSALLKPTKGAGKALEGMGLTIEDVNPMTNELVDIVAALEGANMTAADAVQIFGRRHEGMTILVKAGADALTTMEENITGTNRAAEMASRQLNTTSGDFTLLKSAVDGAAISLGEALAPTMRDITQHLTDVVGWFNKLNPETKALIGKSVAIAGFFSGAAGGAILLGTAMPGIVTGIKTLGTLGPGLLPVGIAIAGIGTAVGLVAAAIGLYHEASKDAFKEQAMKADKANVEGMEEAIAGYSKEIGELVKERDGYARLAASWREQETDEGDKIAAAWEGSVERINTVIGEKQRALETVEGQLGTYADSSGTVQTALEDYRTAQEAANKALGLYTPAAEDANTATVGLGTATTDLKTSSGTDWDDIIDKYNDWIRITGEGYGATTTDAIAYFEEVVRQGGLTDTAQLASENKLSDLWDTYYGDIKSSFLDVTREEKEEFVPRETNIGTALDRELTLYTTKDGEILTSRKQTLGDIIAEGEIFATDRATQLQAEKDAEIALADSMAATRESLAIKEMAFQQSAFDNGADLKALEEGNRDEERRKWETWLADNAKTLSDAKDADMKVINDHFASQKTAYETAEGEVDTYYGNLVALFEQYNIDSTDLQKQWNTAIGELQLTSFTDQADAFGSFLGNITGLQDTFLGDLGDMVGEQVTLLANVAGSWGTVKDTIESISGIDLTGVTSGMAAVALSFVNALITMSTASADQRREDERIEGERIQKFVDAYGVQGAADRMNMTLEEFQKVYNMKTTYSTAKITEETKTRRDEHAQKRVPDAEAAARVAALNEQIEIVNQITRNTTLTIKEFQDVYERVTGNVSLFTLVAGDLKSFGDSLKHVVGMEEIAKKATEELAEEVAADLKELVDKSGLSIEEYNKKVQETEERNQEIADIFYTSGLTIGEFNILVQAARDATENFAEHFLGALKAMIKAEQDAKAATADLTDELAGHSLTTAFESVGMSMKPIIGLFGRSREALGEYKSMVKDATHEFGSEFPSAVGSMDEALNRLEGTWAASVKMGEPIPDTRKAIGGLLGSGTKDKLIPTVDAVSSNMGYLSIDMDKKAEMVDQYTQALKEARPRMGSLGADMSMKAEIVEQYNQAVSEAAEQTGHRLPGAIGTLGASLGDKAALVADTTGTVEVYNQAVSETVTAVGFDFPEAAGFFDMSLEKNANSLQRATTRMNEYNEATERTIGLTRELTDEVESFTNAIEDEDELELFAEKLRGVMHHQGGV